ncbi:MAG: helix-turn-helix domain-containing protein [Candidatus Phaeomarinobacter sp.]
MSKEKDGGDKSPSKRFHLKAEENRKVLFDGPPVTTMPEWGGVADAGPVKFVLHPPLDFELAYRVQEYVIFVPYAPAFLDISVNDGPVRRLMGPAGSAFIVPPGCLVRTRMAEPVEFLCMIVDADYAEGIFQQVAKDRVWAPEIVEAFSDAGFTNLQKEVRRSLLGDPVVEPTYLRALTDAVLARIGCHYAGSAVALRTSNETISPATLRRILAKIDADLAEDLTVAALADEAGLSRSHFTRAFLNETGQSPRDFILNRRVARARELLSSTTIPLADIPSLPGFSSQAHLASAFKRIVGVSPGRYRQSFGGTPES